MVRLIGRRVQIQTISHLTCTGEHGIGAGKISSLEKEAGPGAMAVMLSIKNALDPKGILNPGKVLALPTLK
jgi:FAD/FMN-containing dehydrogenase